MLKVSKQAKQENVRILRFFSQKFKKLHLSEINILFLIAAIVGTGSGFAAVFFRFVLEQLHYIFFGVIWPWLENISVYTLPIIPVIGAILLIPFSKLYPGEVHGYGMPRFLIKVHLKGGIIRTRTIFLKIFTAAITISSGGSAGVEGPIAQVGGAIGSSIGRVFKVGSQRLQILIACGAAAGIAAQFNAPLAGVLFAQEIIMVGKFNLNIFGVIVIASGLATAISRAFYTSEPTFGVLEYSFNGFYELIFYIILGILIGFTAFLFIKVFFRIGDYFHNLKMSENLKPIIGAFIIGVFGILQFGVLGDGYDIIRNIISPNSTVLLNAVALLVLLKILGTAITLGSGNVGGVFAPSLFIGAMMGSVFGRLLNLAFPSLGVQSGSYALVGMGAFLAAATHAPMTAIFLLFELTNDYHIIIPIMFASVIGVMVARKLCPDSIDSMELSRKGIHLHVGKELNIMKSMSVKDVMTNTYEWIPEHMILSAFLKHLKNSRAQYYPVLNQSKELTGIVSFQDIRGILLEEGLEDLVIMKEVMVIDLITLSPDDDLAQAMEKFGSKDIELIPIVDEKDSKKLIGMLKRKDVINAYNKEVLLRQIEERKGL